MSALEQAKTAVPSFADFGPGVQMSVIPADESLATSFDSSLRRVAEDHVRTGVPRRRGDRLHARAGDPLTLVMQARSRSHLYTTTVRAAEQRIVRFVYREQRLLQRGRAI